MFWVAMETHPELNDKIELMVLNKQKKFFFFFYQYGFKQFMFYCYFQVGLAPVASVSRMKSPIRIFTPFIHEFQVGRNSVHLRSLVVSLPLPYLLIHFFCLFKVDVRVVWYQGLPTIGTCPETLEQTFLRSNQMGRGFLRKYFLSALRLGSCQF